MTRYRIGFDIGGIFTGQHRQSLAKRFLPSWLRRGKEGLRPGFDVAASGSPRRKCSWR